MVCFEVLLPDLRLDGGEFENALFVQFDDGVDGVVAEVADAIEKHDGVAAVHDGHAVKEG